MKGKKSKYKSVIDEHGLEKIQAIGVKNGMYKTAEILDTVPYLIRYIAQINNWKRPVPHLQRAVAKGNMYPSFYITVELTEEDLAQHKENRKKYVPKPFDFYGG